MDNEYFPDYVTPPGETLFDILSEMGMSITELSQKMGVPETIIDQIIFGKATITPALALQLQIVLKVSSSFWNNREYHYQQSLLGNANIK